MDVSHCIVRIQLNSAAQFPLGRSRVPIVPEEDAARETCGSARLSSSASALRPRPGEGRDLGGRQRLKTRPKHHAVRIGEPGIRRGVVRLNGNGPLEVFDALVRLDPAVCSGRECRLRVPPR